LDNSTETTTLQIGSYAIAECSTGTTDWAIDDANCKDVDVGRFSSTSGTLKVTVDASNEVNIAAGPLSVYLAAKMTLTYSLLEQTNSTCGELDRRDAAEECASGRGCCINQQEIASELRAQAPCPTEEGDYAHFELSGVPQSCSYSQFNGVGQYVGQTADTRPYYKRWSDALRKWHYIFYDSACQAWVIAQIRPSPTASSNLVGDGSCTAPLGRTVQNSFAIIDDVIKLVRSDFTYNHSQPHHNP
jgi:hypothetical protein